eukprot:m.18398 g.18398  ORF g.18398 m.18398 type:complete len:592 (+) comp27654_c0_seq1:92-1867(+)
MQARLRTAIGSLLATRARKLILILLLAIFIAIYYWKAPKTSKKHFKSAKDGVFALSDVKCVSEILQQWAIEFEAGDVEISIPHFLSSPVLPFIGNGVVGLAAYASGSSLYIAHDGSLSFNVPMSPLVKAAVDGHNMQHGASVVDFRKGLVHQVFYYISKSHCVTLVETMYAHQVVKPLLVQKLAFRSSLEVPVTIQLSHTSLSWTGSTKRQLNLNRPAASGTNSYQLTSGKVPWPAEGLPRDVVLAMATVVPPGAFSLPRLGQKEIYLPTVVIYNRTVYEALSGVEEKASKMIQSVVANPGEAKHIQVWGKLWRSSIAVGFSHDTTIPVQKAVVTSLYYIKSSFYSSPGTSLSPGHCYEGLPAMHTAALWQVPNTEKSFLKLTETWMAFLRKGECGNLLNRGSDWIIQAVTRSFLAIQDTGSHLQVAANPVSLKASVTLTNIAYESQYITLTVTMNRQSLPGRIELVVTEVEPGRRKSLFACAAGCKEDITELKRGVQVAFPVIATTPATPLLFLSSDKQHLLQLREQISWEAHEEHADDGNHLSRRFWITLGLFVGLFHICLLRVVYREYFQGQAEGTKAKLLSSAKATV